MSVRWPSAMPTVSSFWVTASCWARAPIHREAHSEGLRSDGACRSQPARSSAAKLTHDFGIGVGVASLVAMLSLGVGLQRLVSQQLGRSGLFDSIFVVSRQDMRNDR